MRQYWLERMIERVKIDLGQCSNFTETGQLSGDIKSYY